MLSIFIAAGSAFFGAVIGSWLTYNYGLKQDKVVRMRSVIADHLVETYWELNDIQGLLHGPPDDVQLGQRQLTKPLSRIFLFGNEAAIEKASQIAEALAENNDMSFQALMIETRKQLRSELGLPYIEIIPFVFAHRTV